MNATQKEQVKQVVDIVPDLQNRILTIRGERVILDSDLAEIYGVEVRMLNQQVKRNPDRFPEDFSFILSKAEWEAVVALRSQIVTLKRGQHRKYLPRVFTEHGALMAANVLNSKRAVEMSVYVVRAFIKMRSALSETRVLARKLASLEREVKSRLDSHDAAIVEVMQRILDLIDPPEHADPPPPPPPRIGFSVKRHAVRLLSLPPPLPPTSPRLRALPAGGMRAAPTAYCTIRRQRRRLVPDGAEADARGAVSRVAQQPAAVLVVVLVVALEPGHAAVALEGQDVGGDAV